MICYSVNKLDTNWLIEDKKYIRSCLHSLKKLLMCKQETVVSLLQEHWKIEFSVNLINNQRMQQLNYQYRGKNTTTNVLSFPMKEEIDSCYYLGDICLAREVIIREAVVQNKSFYLHLAHLLCHGLLHLLDYNHEDEASAKAMISCEVQLLAALGIEDPIMCDTINCK